MMFFYLDIYVVLIENITTIHIQLQFAIYKKKNSKYSNSKNSMKMHPEFLDMNNCLNA